MGQAVINLIKTKTSLGNVNEKLFKDEIKEKNI